MLLNVTVFTYKLPHNTYPMKNNNFLKQNILILIVAVFSFIIGLWNTSDTDLYLWIFSIPLLLIYCPVAYLKYNRLKSNKESKTIDLSLNIILWSFMILSVLPFLYSVWGNIFFHSEFSPLVNLKIYFITFGLDKLIAITGEWIQIAYYLIFAILFFLAIQSKKKK
jgi:uncharacterized membrane protein YiaA